MEGDEEQRGAVLPRLPGVTAAGLEAWSPPLPILDRSAVQEAG